MFLDFVFRLNQTADNKIIIGISVHDFQLDEQAVLKGFERAAKSYNKAAILPQEIIARSMERLSYIKCEPELVVDVGAGTGLALPGLKARFPAATIVPLDRSPAMLGQSTFPGAVCADAGRLPFADRTVDVMFASFVLPYLNDLPSILREWARVLKPTGLLMFSTLGPDSFDECRQAWSQVDEQFRVHPFYDMHDIGDMLLKARFRDPVMDAERITLTYQTFKHMFDESKAQAAGNKMRGRYKGLTTPRQLAKFQAAYGSFREGGVLPVTLEVVHAHAFGADLASGVSANGEVRIPISHLKHT